MEKKTLFLLALGLALSNDVGFITEEALVSLMLDFRAKNDNKVKRLTRNCIVKELAHLMGPEEERKLCPVRALRAYLDRTKNLRQDQVRKLKL